jgi:hypothetical protein
MGDVAVTIVRSREAPVLNQGYAAVIKELPFLERE